MLSYEHCEFCPRKCGVDRRTEKGYCGAPDVAVVAKTMLHMWEEPVISGTRGSGAVFFSGCGLRCSFCQNKDISRGITGIEYDANALAGLFLELKDKGAHNINLVTATPYLKTVIDALALVKKDLNIPVVFNSGGYETEEAVCELEPYVDIFMPDLKYYSSKLSGQYSNASDYNEVATKAVRAMLKARPEPVIRDGLMKSGVIIRHLVLPGCTQDSINVLRQIASFDEGKPLVSVMSQFTPEFAENAELKRKITTYEYRKVTDEVVKLGLDGFFQERESATSGYTPDFKREV